MPREEFLPEQHQQLLHQEGVLRPERGDVLEEAHRSLPHGPVDLHLSTRVPSSDLHRDGREGVGGVQRLEEQEPEDLLVHERDDEDVRAGDVAGRAFRREDVPPDAAQRGDLWCHYVLHCINHQVVKSKLFCLKNSPIFVQLQTAMLGSIKKKCIEKSVQHTR